MNRIGVDIIGEISLISELGRKSPINKEYWGHGNIKGEKRNDSYFLYLIDKDQLNPGETCKAEFKFKFSDDDRFEIKIVEGQIIELNEGSRKIGDFLIQEIVNEKLK